MAGLSSVVLEGGHLWHVLLQTGSEMLTVSRINNVD